MGDIGKRIKELRTQGNLSQYELASKLNLKQNTISEYENNIKRPSYDTLIAIADFFDVSLDFLTGRIDY